IPSQCGPRLHPTKAIHHACAKDSLSFREIMFSAQQPQIVEPIVLSIISWNDVINLNSNPGSASLAIWPDIRTAPLIPLPNLVCDRSRKPSPSILPRRLNYRRRGVGRLSVDSHRRLRHGSGDSLSLYRASGLAHGVAFFEKILE